MLFACGIAGVVHQTFHFFGNGNYGSDPSPTPSTLESFATLRAKSWKTNTLGERWQDEASQPTYHLVAFCQCS